MQSPGHPGSVLSIGACLPCQALLTVLNRELCVWFTPERDEQAALFQHDLARAPSLHPALESTSVVHVALKALGLCASWNSLSGRPSGPVAARLTPSQHGPSKGQGISEGLRAGSGSPGSHCSTLLAFLTPTRFYFPQNWGVCVSFVSSFGEVTRTSVPLLPWHFTFFFV